MINFHSQGFKQYFANTSWMMAEKIIRLVVAFFVGIYVARYLGPERFGLLSYAMSFVGLFSIISILGLDEIIVRDLVHNHTQKETTLGTVFLLKVTGFIIMFSAVYITAHLSSNDDYTIKLILIITLGILFQSFNVIDIYFESQVLAKFSSFSKMCSLTGASLIKIWLILTKASLLWFAWIFVIENSLLAIFLVVLYRNNNLKICQWRFKKNKAFIFLRDSWPLMLSGLAVMVYMRIDQVMIKAILGSEAVGNYAVAVKISEAFYFIPMAVSSSLFPAIINAKQMNTTLYFNNVQRLFDLMTWMSVAIALPTAILADALITFLFGDNYLFAAGVLKIHIWAGIFVFLGVASGKWLVAENLQKYSFYRTLVGVIVNVILNLLFIPKFGIKGAAYATLLSQLSAVYLSMAFVRPIRKSFYMATKSFNPVAAGKRIFNVYS